MSFAWLAYDVLAVVKQQNVVNDENYSPSSAPVFEVSVIATWFLVTLALLPLNQTTCENPPFCAVPLGKILTCGQILLKEL